MADSTIRKAQAVDGILEIQKAVADAMLANTYFAKARIQILPENVLDIVTQVRSAIGKLGIVGMVMTPHLAFQGKDRLGHPVWRMEEIHVTFTEIPTTNRGRAGASTALDAALVAAESLNEAGLLLKDIQQTEQAGYVIVTVTCQASAYFGYRRVDKDTASAGTTVNTPPTP